MGWKRLAVDVAVRRTHLGYRTRRQFAEGTGFAEKTLGDLERCRRSTFTDVTFGELEKALRWPEGRVRELLGQPDDGLDVIEPVAVDPEPEPSHPEIPTAEAELSTLAGLHAWLHRLDPAVLGALLHRSGLDFETRWALVNAERERAVAQLRENWVRMASEILDSGGVVDVDTWPSWLEAPPLVDETRKQGSEGPAA